MGRKKVSQILWRKQTVSDMVDSRRGGQLEQSLAGSVFPEGLNSNWAIRLACAPWLMFPVGRAQNELLRLALRLRLLFRMFAMRKLLRPTAFGQFGCCGFLHSGSSQQNDWSLQFQWLHKEKLRKQKENVDKLCRHGSDSFQLSADWIALVSCEWKTLRQYLRWLLMSACRIAVSRYRKRCSCVALS